MATEVQKNSGILAVIEKAGNKMPHPLALFLWIIVIVLALSAILAFVGVSAIHPQTGKVVEVKNLLSPNALIQWGSMLIKNLQNFPVLASVLIMGAATGLCEQVGLFTVAIKSSLQKASGVLVTYIIAVIGTCAHVAGDVSFFIVPSIAASIFYGMKRNPLVGLFLGYGAVGGGYGVALIPTGIDVILTPISIQAAHVLDPTFDMNVLNGYYMCVGATLFVSAIATIITVKFLEPKFGRYTGTPEGITSIDNEVTPLQMKALKYAFIAVVVYVFTIAAICFPEASILRSPTGSLTINAPLMKIIFALLFLLFIIPGLVFAHVANEIRNVRQLAAVLTKAVTNVVPFVVIALVVSQFLYLFSQSNLGTVLAINGGNLLKSLSIPVLAILVLFLLLEGFADLFIVSSSSRYLIFGPVFVPMFMQLGVHPAVVQMVHRMGGSVCNHLTPLNSFFPVVLGLAQKYDKNIGIGTVFSAMIPFTIGYTLAYSAYLIFWYLMDLPLGPGIFFHYTLPVR